MALGLLGCHVSIEGGVQNAPLRGHELGCEAIQIFTRNQRQWKSKAITEDQVQEFRRKILEYQIQEVMTHSIYLINLASADRNLRKRSETAFLDELHRCEALGISYLVFHPGSYRESTEKKGINRLVNSLQRLLAKTEENSVSVLLENTDGAGSLLGSSFEQLAEIRDQTGSLDRVKFCFDTAHAFAAGYDICTPEGFNKVMDDFDRIIGLHHLKAFHINDSKADLGSHRDRHENIGYGYIGAPFFEKLVNDPRFEHHPMILETPGGNDWFMKNLQLLFQFRNKGS
ncbi:MAG: deoxyribonuclease IV [Candidatus Thorarchaeota archaeon]